jgi:hypothetical protein
MTVMRRWFVPILLLVAAATMAQPPKPAGNFLQQAFGIQPLSRNPLLSAEFPWVSLLLANRAAEVQSPQGGAEAVLRAPGSEAILAVRLEHRGVFDYCRIRHREGSPIPPDELKIVWAFPMEFNESMTMDAGALAGHPLYLPDGTVPPAHHVNWGTLFYNRASNLALGTVLEGAQPAVTHYGQRSGPTGPTHLHFWTSMGRPDLQLTIFAYRPRDQRLWWAEWVQEQGRRSPGLYPHLFPVLSPLELSWAPGERAEIEIVPGPADAGKAMEFVLNDDVADRIVSRKRFQYELPVTHLTLEVGNWLSGLYRAVVVPAGTPVDPAVRDFNQKILTLILRPDRPRGTVLFVAPTDMWRAYAGNGGHAMTSWRNRDDYDSVGYSPTVLNTRFRRTNHYYYGLYERHSDIKHYRFLRELAQKDGFQIDYCTQDDIARGRVRLADYRLALIGSHAEFTTAEGYFRFRDYMALGGAVMIHGGDSFAVMVEYLPDLQHPRYIWQRDHFWCLLGDEPDNFLPPRLLPNPEHGDAIDYLNLFHNTVTYWPRDSAVVVSNVTHPVTAGLGLKEGETMPGTWGGETDIAYEPGAWDILLRSEKAATDVMSNGLERVTQVPFHRPVLMIHKNLRLAEVSGEAFTGVLADPRGALFRTLYARTLHYLLDSAIELRAGERIPANGWEFPLSLRAIRYTLPEFIDYQDRLWFRKRAPYAHYVIEGSNDGESWTVLADRTRGPWRGMQTDFLSSATVRKVRFRGAFSNGEPFRVKDVVAFRAQ